MRDRLDILVRPLLLVTMLVLPFAVPTAALALDGDCDGVEDGADNCPAKFNPTQDDLDGDLAGDRCDSDKDGDFLDNSADNCPKDANASQEDGDGDGVGDACDECAGDAAAGVVDRRGCTIDQHCPCDGPQMDQAWRDHGDYLRCVRRKARKFRLHDLVTADERRAILVAARDNSCGDALPEPGDNDGDGVGDAADNCPSDSNPSQKNTDGDEFGDACDTDRDNDTVLNASDNCPAVANVGGQADDADGDGSGDACDACSGTDPGDVVDREGCSIAQACPCEADEDGNPWGGHRKYERCVRDEVFRFRLLGYIDADEADAIRAQAGESSYGERPPICE